jgi:hypothetical protein
LIELKASLALITECSASVFIENTIIAKTGTGLTLRGHHSGSLRSRTLLTFVLFAEAHIISVKMLHILTPWAFWVTVAKSLTFYLGEILLASQTLICTEACHATDRTRLALRFLVKILTIRAVISLLCPKTIARPCLLFTAEGKVHNGVHDVVPDFFDIFGE